MDHPAIAEGNVAVITGGASGIGLAVAKTLASKGMRICIADNNHDTLNEATKSLDGDPLVVVTDVSDRTSVESLKNEVLSRFGQVDILMNNAGTSIRGVTSFSAIEAWQQILGVNLWGVINGLQAFGELMVSQGRPGAIINTGSKQGLTNPPGNPAYNISKAGVRTLTESLAHELRAIDNCAITAHLLVPGFTYTGMIAKVIAERPPGAWLPEQVADLLLERLARGDFYIICPDNETTETIDHRRMQWNLDDILQGRPALSRWHADYAEDFRQFMDSED
ncbi:MAG: SDR family NAD(P)-dependent oxidoreductase [Pseudomonadota bacterium]